MFKLAIASKHKITYSRPNFKIYPCVNISQDTNENCVTISQQCKELKLNIPYEAHDPSAVITGLT